MKDEGKRRAEEGETEEGTKKSRVCDFGITVR